MTGSRRPPGSIEQSIDNCRMLLACPTQPVDIPHPTHPPPASAGTAWPPPAVIGAIDEGVWELIPKEGRRELERRYVRDAGLRKRDLARLALRWVRLTEAQGKVERLEGVEVEL